MDTTTLIIIIFACIGILNTLYLTSHAITKKPVKCIGFPDEWCKKVQTSKFSKTFGIPNAVLGLCMYVALLVLALLFNSGTVPFWPITVIVTFGFLFSLYFTAIQAFVLKAFCTWCVISALEFITLFIVVMLR